MQFKDVIGQEGLKQRLIQAARAGHVPHAQLFVGDEASGVLPLVLAYAQYLQCDHPGASDSCGVCPQCVQMAKLVHPEVHFVFPVVKERSDKATLSDDKMAVWREALQENPYMTCNEWMDRIRDGAKQGGIFVEESTALIRKLSFSSAATNYKMVIVWMANKMGPVPANKLLKILEEPNERTLFMMIAPDTQQMLPTVLSRMQLVKVPPLPASAGGYAGSAAFFDDFVAMMRTAYMAFSSNPARNEMQHLSEWAARMAQRSRDEQKSYLQYAQRMIRESYLVHLNLPGLTDMSEQERAFVSRFAPFVNNRNVEDITGLLNLASAHIEANGNQTLVFFDTGLQLALCLHR